MVQDKPILPSTSDNNESKYDHTESKYDIVDYDDPNTNPFIPKPVAVRISNRKKVMSSAGAASAASAHDTYHFTANILQSIITSDKEAVESVHN